MVAHRHQQNRAKRGGECESRDWRTISRSYPKSCQPNCPLRDGLRTHVTRCSFNAKGYSYSFRLLVQLESSRAPPCALRNAVLSRRAQQAPPSVASRIRLCSRKWIPEPPSSPGRRAHQLAQSSPPRFVVQAPPCVTSRGPPLLAQVDSPSRRARPRGLAGLRHRRVPPPHPHWALPSSREKRPSGQEGRVIAPKPGPALPSQRELARLDKSRHRSL